MARFADLVKPQIESPVDGGRFASLVKPAPQVVPQELSQPAQPETQEPGFFDFFTGTSRETPETKSLPEIGSVPTGSTGKDIKLAAGLLVSLDDQEKIDVIKSIVPGSTTREDEKGNIVVTYPDGQESILNKPGFSFQDGVQIASQIAAFTPAGFAANVGKSLLAKVGLGAMASGATETAIQAGAQVAGSEQGFDPSRIATATALGGAAETIGPVVKAVKQRLRAKQVTTKPGEITSPEELAEITELSKTGLEASKQTGISLARPQLTGIESELTRQRTVASLPAGAREAKKFLDNQSEQSSAAVDRLLNSIAPASAVETGEEGFRSASKLAIDARIASRREKSSGLFEKAMAEGAKTDLSKTRAAIAEALKDAPPSGDLLKSISKIEKLLGLDDATKIIDGNLRKLQNAKFQIDAMLDGSAGKVIDETVKIQVATVKRELVSSMEKASPSYKSANKAFADESPAIEQLEKSIIGKAGRVSDTELKSISGKIFDPAQTNVTTIRAAKKVIDSVDPKAWNQLLRVEIEKRLGKVRADLTDISGENVPSMLRNAIFGNTKQRNVLMAGAGGELKKNLTFLEEALKRGGRGRPGGSDTAQKQEAIAEFKSKGKLRSIVDFFTSTTRAFTEGGDKILNDRKIAATAKILFDPNWTPRLTKVRKLTNKQKQSEAMKTLLTEALKSTQAEIKGAAQATREQSQQEKLK